MNKRTKRVLNCFIVLLGVFLAFGIYIYASVWVPMQQMQDEDWWDNASEDEIRDLCHKAISTRFGFHHDAFLALSEIGNAESVPLLIRALKWQDFPGENGVMICTTDHCLMALNNLTGHDAGSSYQEWNIWWKETGSKLPKEEFYPRNEKEFHTKDARKPLEAIGKPPPQR